MFAAEVDATVVALVGGLLVSIGMGIMSWQLITLVKLTNLVAVLEAKIVRLEKDYEKFEDLLDGHPEIRRS